MTLNEKLELVNKKIEILDALKDCCDALEKVVQAKMFKNDNWAINACIEILRENRRLIATINTIPIDAAVQLTANSIMDTTAIINRMIKLRDQKKTFWQRFFNL